MAITPQARATPRISANELALFMVSSDTTRVSIVRRAKFPSKPPLIRYKDARPAVTGHLSSPTRARQPLDAARALLTHRMNDSASSALAKDDAARSIEVLDAIIRMANQLGQYDFQLAPAQQPKLLISGVEVSVRADLLVHGASRGVEQIGAAILRLTDADEGEAGVERRHNMGTYVATLARLQVERNIRSNRQPANRLCMSIDVQQGEVFVTPNAIARRVNDLESACTFIAALWPTI